MRFARSVVPAALSVCVAFAAVIVASQPASSSMRSAAAAAVLPIAGDPALAAAAAAIPVRSSVSPAAASTAAAAAFDPSKVALKLTLVKGGFSSPVLVTNAHDGSNRLFVVEQAGVIRILQAGVVKATPFLDLRGSISSGGERGLLGLAFDPKFPTYPYIYVNFTDTHGNTAISRYTVSANANVVNRSSGVRILTITQPYPNHNGGNLAFGPDGYLYIGMGDGGDAGDPGNRAQDLDSLLGKMLRIDIHRGTRTTHYVAPADNPFVGKTGNDLIWSRGLRNPWRWSFDSLTGALWIGDVGQDRWEEVDRSVPAAGVRAGRGVNYGWNVMEGRACFKPATGCSTYARTMPVVTYGHVVTGGDNCSVTGGFVYRGTASPVLQGGYLYGDFCSGRIWAIAAGATSPATPTLLKNDTTAPVLSLSSFGQDEAHELYVTDLAGGGLYRLSATAKP